MHPPDQLGGSVANTWVGAPFLLRLRRVQRRIASLQSSRLVDSDQSLGLLRALMVLGVLPEPSLISLRLDGSRRPETLALVQVGRVGLLQGVVCYSPRVVCDMGHGIRVIQQLYAHI